jgi:hypothetical protein
LRSKDAIREQTREEGMVTVKKLALIITTDIACIFTACFSWGQCAGVDDHHFGQIWWEVALGLISTITAFMLFFAMIIALRDRYDP